jgi:hypothetical protein
MFNYLLLDGIGRNTGLLQVRMDGSRSTMSGGVPAAGGRAEYLPVI